MRTFEIVAIAAALVPSALAAADAPEPPAPAKELRCLIGSWRGAGTMSAGGAAFPVQATYECRAIAGGFGVGCRFALTGIPGMPRYELDDVWGYDPGDGRVHWYTVTNAGETHDHAGTIDADRFVGRFVGRRDGKPFTEDVAFRFEDEEHLRARSTGRVDGKTVEVLELAMTKASARR